MWMDADATSVNSGENYERHTGRAGHTRFAQVNIGLFPRTHETVELKRSTGMTG